MTKGLSLKESRDSKLKRIITSFFLKKKKKRSWLSINMSAVGE